jgi:hypothetical protein
MTDVENVIYRMKNIRQFIVTVDLPDTFQLNGIMPFDVKIRKNKGWFKVYALTLEEAQEKVNEFVNKLSSE